MVRYQHPKAAQGPLAWFTSALMAMALRQDDNSPNKRFGVVNLVLIGLGLLITLLLNSWRQSEGLLEPLPRRVGQAALAYTLLQSFFDVSLIHWPITQVFTGILLAIPLSVNGSVTTPDRS